MAAAAIVALPLAVRTYEAKIIDKLQSPIAVTGWSDKGLLLADGRTVSLPGIRMLPGSSAALGEAGRRGVELGRDGRVFALVRVQHWCGNDPVREHVARVDLSYLLMFLGEGQAAYQLAPELRPRMAEEPGGRFSASGWEIDEYSRFRSWCRLANELGDAATHAGPRSMQPRPPTATGRQSSPVPSGEPNEMPVSPVPSRRPDRTPPAGPVSIVGPPPGFVC